MGRIVCMKQLVMLAHMALSLIIVAMSTTTKTITSTTSNQKEENYFVLIYHKISKIKDVFYIFLFSIDFFIYLELHILQAIE